MAYLCFQTNRGLFLRGELASNKLIINVHIKVEGPGSWLPPSNVLPFPDCSVAALSSVISIPTDLKLSVVSSRKEDKETTLCDDSFFLKQVDRNEFIRIFFFHSFPRLLTMFARRFSVSWKWCVEIHFTVTSWT